jgi:predicted nucleic acid-binding protein
MPGQPHHLDANVILRFLLDDVPSQSKEVLRLFRAAEAGDVRLFLSHVCLAEVAWVLGWHYELEPARIAVALKGLLLHGGVEAEDDSVLFDALERYAAAKVSFIDAYNAASAAATGSALITFDKGYRKFADVTARTPAQLLEKHCPRRRSG